MQPAHRRTRQCRGDESTAAQLVSEQLRTIIGVVSRVPLRKRTARSYHVHVLASLCDPRKASSLTTRTAPDSGASRGRLLSSEASSRAQTAMSTRSDSLPELPKVRVHARARVRPFVCMCACDGVGPQAKPPKAGYKTKVTIDTGSFLNERSGDLSRYEAGGETAATRQRECMQTKGRPRSGRAWLAGRTILSQR